MADVTIDALTPGTPSSAASVPFSDAGVTKEVAPGLLLANAGFVGIGTETGKAIPEEILVKRKQARETI